MAYAPSLKRLEALKDRLRQERDFMASVGNDLAGYIENYHVKYGRSIENAKEIYRADQDIVDTLVAQIDKFEPLVKQSPNYYQYDDVEYCKQVLEFFDKGTASHFEVGIVTALQRADLQTRARIAQGFPALVQAYLEKQKA